jgi:PilZ domain-containing protein
MDAVAQRLSCSKGTVLNRDRPDSERRKWERLPLAIPVFVRNRDENGKELLEFATALNVSAGGVLVAVRRSLPLSSQVTLEIPSAPLVSRTDLPKSSRNLRGRTIWVTHAEGYQLVGLKFSHALLNSNSDGKPRRRKVVSSM